MKLYTVAKFIEVGGQLIPLCWINGVLTQVAWVPALDHKPRS